MSARICDWCRGRIPDGSRVDAITCSKRCRQARHRFRTAIAGAPVAAGHPRRLAYADPPYPGKAHYYKGHPDYAGEVDHGLLIASLSAEYDAWALSTSASALQDVLALCPPGVRVAAWFRGERPNDQTDLPQNAWEPVIYAGDVRRLAVDEDLHDASRSAAARRDTSRRPGAVAEIPRNTSRRTDTLIYHSRPRLTDPGRVIGAKPAAFCRWIFDLLGATPADTLVDVFPGSAGVARAWSVFCEQEASA